MKCVCGYEHESGIDDKGKYQDDLIGDEEFTKITGVVFKDETDFFNERKVYLFACPKCGTVRMERYL